MAGKSLTRQMTMAIGRHFTKDELLGLVADGMSLRKIAAEAAKRMDRDIPHAYVHKLLKSYGEDYEQAKRDQAQTHAERIGEIAQDVEQARLDPASARVASDNRKWLASRLDPSQYGDKIQADVRITDMAALHLAALKAMMGRARVVPELEHEREPTEGESDQNPD